MADIQLTRPHSGISDTEEAFYRKRRSFTSGFVITSRKEVLLWSKASGGDDNYYQWMGALPKTVAAGSTPDTTGGRNASNWVSRGNANYLESLNGDISDLDTRVTAIEQNPQGKSAYESYLDTTTDNPPKTESQWVASLKGDTGSGLVIKGSFGSTADLPLTGNTPGDAYIIQDQMWVWDSVQWSPVGQVGPEGKSAYQVWLRNGHTGTEQDFLASLIGPVGPQGPQGQKGDPGVNANGFIYQGTLSSTAELPASTASNISWAYTINGSLYVSSAQGWINLGNIVGPQGPKGDKGDKGDTGIQGPAGPQGNPGQKGDQGPQGAQGVPGQDGAGLVIVDQLTDVSQLPTTGVVGEAYIVGTDLYVWLRNGTAFVNVGPIVGPKGDKGDKGDQGIQGPAGPQGNTGPAGQNGQDGHSVVAKGYLNSTSALPTTGNNPADMYYVSGVTYIWDGSTWVNMGSNVGPAGKDGTRGDPGPQGLNGVDGRSAYQVWLDEGNQGTEADFITSLTGPQGVKGDKGDKGDQGDIGPGVEILGTVNSTADLPSTGTVGQGYLIGTDFYVWTGSQYTNVGPIRGPKGDKGDTGNTGPAGATGATGAKGDKGDQGSLWIVLAREPGPSDGRLGDYFIDSTTNRYYQKTSSTNWGYMGTMGGGNVYDAPNDGVYYVRRNQGWVADPVQEAPKDGTQYARTNGAWTAISFPTPPVQEAPTDGQQYIRKNSGWAVLTLPSNVVTEAPVNTNLYARSNGSWVTFAAGISDAPINTTTTYGRANGAWAAVTPEAPTTAGAYYVRSGSAWQRLNRYDLAIGAATATLDVSTQQVFTVDLSTARTLTLTNMPSGRAMPIVIIFTGNAGGVSWTNTISWTDNTAPTYSANRTVITLLWDGSAFIGLKPGGY